ncbi:MAG: hypothetical protein PF961_00650 [Planctomycetota bacterium]|jgi:hypothetical protein|nr:hypothetical protein [Planctomycetota bacterium]
MRPRLDGEADPNGNWVKLRPFLKDSKLGRMRTPPELKQFELYSLKYPHVNEGQAIDRLIDSAPDIFDMALAFDLRLDFGAPPILTWHDDAAILYALRNVNRLQVVANKHARLTQDWSLALRVAAARQALAVGMYGESIHYLALSALRDYTTNTFKDALATVRTRACPMQVAFKTLRHLIAIDAAMDQFDFSRAMGAGICRETWDHWLVQVPAAEAAMDHPLIMVLDSDDPVDQLHLLCLQEVDKNPASLNRQATLRMLIANSAAIAEWFDLPVPEISQRIHRDKETTRQATDPAVFRIYSLLHETGPDEIHAASQDDLAATFRSTLRSTPNSYGKVLYLAWRTDGQSAVLWANHFTVQAALRMACVEIALRITATRLGRWPESLDDIDVPTMPEGFSLSDPTRVDARIGYDPERMILWCHEPEKDPTDKMEWVYWNGGLILDLGPRTQFALPQP